MLSDTSSNSLSKIDFADVATRATYWPVGKVYVGNGSDSGACMLHGPDDADGLGHEVPYDVARRSDVADQRN